MGGDHIQQQGSTHPILARGVPSEVSAQATARIMWMPGGVHEITATRAGKPVKVRVQVDRSTAAAAQQALDRHMAASRQRPYLDFNHAATEASAWPIAFEWSDTPEPGVYAQVEWSDAGRAAITGKRYRSFSPSFFVDGSDPARVTDAPLNMGGLVNDPAFRAMAPIWARSAQPQMNEQNTGAATAVGVTTTHGNTAATQPTQAQAGGGGENVVVAIQDATTALAAKDQTIHALRTDLEKANQALAAQRKTQATLAVTAAIARGAIPAANEELKAKWIAEIESNPAAETLLSAIPGNVAVTAGRITQPSQSQVSSVVISREATTAVIQAYHGERDPLKRGCIYRDEIRARIHEDGGAVIKAANSLGTTATDIVSQRVLEQLIEMFPELRRITTDLSAEAVDLKYGKTINVSLLTPPTAGTYHTTNGYVSQDAVGASRPVVCNQHKFVQHTFNAEELSGSSLDLFTRHAPNMAYALGLDLVTYIYALITAANFTNQSVVTLANFDRRGVITIGTALNNRKVPKLNRTLVLTPDYAGELFSDEAIVSLATFNRPEVITRGAMPDVHGFTTFEALSLPTAENLKGFGFTPDALAMVVRVPSEYANALPGVTGGGVVSTIIEPNTGLAVQKVDFVDHQKGFASSRLAWMYGAAVGQAASGQRLVSSAS